MPHYKDGTLAIEGDIVKGIPYNVGGKEVVGIISNINPSVETCNCRVTFFERLASGMINVDDHILPLISGTDQILYFVRIRSDYGEVKAFEKVL